MRSNEVRTIQKNDGSYWFVAKDVAKALGYVDTNQAIRNHCESAEILKGVESTGLTSSPRGINIISKPDVYRLVTMSKLPQAKRFQKWLFEEVLPQIEATGSYKMPVCIEQLCVAYRSVVAY